MRGLWLAVAILVICVRQVTSNPLNAQQDEDWIESGITEDLVKTQISNATCFSSAKYLKSCKDAETVATQQLADRSGWPNDDFDRMVSSIADLATKVGKSKQPILGMMLQAHLKVFDPHAFIAPSATLQEQIGSGTDTRFGIGVDLLPTGAGVFVRKVTPGSPAFVAGLRPFDRIVTVNNAEMGTGLVGYKNMDLITGDPGDTIKLSLDRNGEYRTVTVQIGLVHDPNLQSADIVGTRYGYAWLREMRTNSCSVLASGLQEMRSRIDGFVLDLRDNRGGLLDEAICIASLFLGERRIVGEKFVTPSIPMDMAFRPALSQITWRTGSRSRTTFLDLPIVVLINAGTASGAEIIVGALQDYGRARLVGERTFGKGSVQTVREVTGYPKLKVGFTSASYYRPNGTSPLFVGVTPDFEVPVRHNARAAERQFMREYELFPATPSIEPVTSSRQSTAKEQSVRRCAESRLDTQESADYQAAYGVAILGCESRMDRRARFD